MGFKEYFRVLEILLIVPFAMYVSEGLFHDCASGIDLQYIVPFLHCLLMLCCGLVCPFYISGHIMVDIITIACTTDTDNCLYFASLGDASL